MQCYEGLDANSALYEWNYPKQLLRIKMDEQCNLSPEEMGQVIYSESYLVKKPGISETLDWAEALIKLHRNVLDEETIEQTLGCILKYREDIQKFQKSIWGDPAKRSRLLTSYTNHEAG